MQSSAGTESSACWTAPAQSLLPCAYDGLAWDGGTAWVKLSDGWHEYTIPGVTKPDPLADLPDSVTAPDTYPARTDAVFSWRMPTAPTA